MSSQPQKLRILMLHGFTQSGSLFEIKTKALKKSLEKAFPPAPKAGHLNSHPGGLEFVYPTAPMKLSYTDIPGGVAEPEDLREEAYGWWKRKGDSEPYLYDGLDEGLKALAQILREEGPFDGVVGFSQGGSAAGMLAALLEPGRREAFEALEAAGAMGFPRSFVGEDGEDSVVHPQMKFAILDENTNRRFPTLSPRAITPSSITRLRELYTKISLIYRAKSPNHVGHIYAGLFSRKADETSY
ncbi:hypothetical protein BST61_g1718 [Cercospora zeina]